MSLNFNVGDKVTAYPMDEGFVRSYAGRPDSDGTYTVTAIVNQLVRVTGSEKMMFPRSISYTRFRLHAPVRVEGEEISPADIQIGDEILVTREGHNITHMRQGVVGEIARQNHSGLDALLFKTKGQYHGSGERLNWGMDYTETIVLVTAVPERDVLLDRLVGSLAGQVISFRGSLSRKRNDEFWDTLTGAGSGVSGDSTVALRQHISTSDVVWLKAGE